MLSLKKLSIATVGTMTIGIGSIAPVSAASFYQITGLDFVPSDINDSAQVVGENYFWQNGNVTDLNTLPGANNSNLSATAINNNGAIAGVGLTVNASTTTQETIPGQAFISDGKTISALPCNYFCNDNQSRASIVTVDLNDSGTVALIPDYGTPAIVQKSDGTTTEAATASRILNIAINNQDQVAATGFLRGGDVYGIFSENGNQTKLANPSNPGFSTRPESYANDIDDSGNIVGSFGTSTSSSRLIEATLWTDANQPGVRLGTLGGEVSEALGINNSQQVVGTSTLSNGFTEHAFLWEDGDLIDLNSLIDLGQGWELTSAFEINNNGDIIGVGFYNGQQRGFVAKAIPEPSSVLGILGLGLFGLSNWRKRKK